MVGRLCVYQALRKRACLHVDKRQHRIRGYPCGKRERRYRNRRRLSGQACDEHSGKGVLLVKRSQKHSRRQKRQGNRRLRFHQLLQSPIRDAARRVKRAWRARFSGLPRVAEHKIARQSQRSEKEFFSVLQKHDVRRFGRRYPFCGGVCVFRLRQAFRA